MVTLEKSFESKTKLNQAKTKNKVETQVLTNIGPEEPCWVQKECTQGKKIQMVTSKKSFEPIPKQNKPRQQ